MPASDRRRRQQGPNVAARIADFLTKPMRQSQLYNCLMAARDTAAVPHRVPAPVVQTKRGQSHARVLVAEDNIVNQEVARAMLETLGCEIDLADNGREAVNVLDRQAYDLVFMDCQMPEMDGFEAVRRFRSAAHTRRKFRVTSSPRTALSARRTSSSRPKFPPLEAGVRSPHYA